MILGRSIHRFSAILVSASSRRTFLCSSASSIQQRRHYYSVLRTNMRLMPIKSIEVIALPGPEFRDEHDNVLHIATILDIYIPEGHAVVAGDNVMVLQKKSNDNINRELLFIAAPVSGTMKKTYVKARDLVVIGDKLFDIETPNADDDVTEDKGPLAWNFNDPVTMPPTKSIDDQAPKPKKRVLPLPPLSKEQQREYRFVQNEVDCIKKEIHAVDKMYPEGNYSVDSMATKIQLYERILALQKEAYENVVQVAITRSAKEEERLFYDRLNDPDPLEVADTLQTLGRLLAEAGNTTAALRHMKEAVIWRRRKNRISGFQHMGLLADALVQLGKVRQKVEDLEGAKRDFFEAYKLQVRVVGHNNHPAIAHTIHVLGDIHAAQGMMEEALRSYGSALEIYREMVSNTPRMLNLAPLGGARPETDEQKRHRYTLDTANILQNMSSIMASMDDLPGALDHSKQELRLRTSLASSGLSLDEDKIRIAACHFVIAERIIALNQKTKGSPLAHYEAAMKIYESLHGRQHKSVAMIYLSIGALHMESKHYHEAHLSYKEGAELLEAIDGYVVIFGDVLCFSYLCTLELSRWLFLIVFLRCSCDSPNDPNVAAAYLYVGQALFQQGEAYYDYALKQFLYAYNILQRLDPASNSEGELREKQASEDGEDSSVEHYKLILATTIESICNIYKLQDRLGEAQDFCQQALQLSLNVASNRHPNVASLYNTLGELYSAQGNIFQSLKMYEQARDIFAKLFGKNHPHTASVHFNIGLALRKDPDRRKEAIMEIETARDQWTKSMGADGSVHIRKAEKLLAELRMK
jgi:tetratricopeptide (TPR) repeat protein